MFLTFGIYILGIVLSLVLITGYAMVKKEIVTFFTISIAALSWIAVVIQIIMILAEIICDVLGDRVLFDFRERNK